MLAALVVQSTGMKVYQHFDPKEARDWLLWSKIAMGTRTSKPGAHNQCIASSKPHIWLMFRPALSEIGYSDTLPGVVRFNLYFDSLIAMARWSHFSNL